MEYIDEAEFIRDIKEENHYGTPMTITVYREADGSAIPTDFVQNLDPSPQGFEIVDSPYLRSSHVDEMLAQAEQIAKESDVGPAPERFFVIDLDRGYQKAYGIWDDIRDEQYVDEEGVSEEFSSEWEANA